MEKTSEGVVCTFRSFFHAFLICWPQIFLVTENRYSAEEELLKMKIKKILNQNAVLVDDDGEEKVAIGKGIGFEKKTQ